MIFPEPYRLTRDTQERFARLVGITPPFPLPPTVAGDPAGYFVIPKPGAKTGAWLQVIATDGVHDGTGWAHVSASLYGATALRRCPSWEEMCYLKDLFWPKDEATIQFHPAEADYINNHPYCLHIWQPVGFVLPTPPPELVGLRRR